MRRFSTVLICLLWGGTLIAGSGNRTGTNGASELLIPVGTRDIAMAGSTVALTSGPEALFWNPAGVAGVRHAVTLFASHMSYIADIGVEYASVAVDFGGFGVMALQLKALSVGNIPLTTVYTPDGSGQTFSPQFLTVGVSYGRQLTDRIRVGATINVVSEEMAEVSATGFAFDMGVIYTDLVGVRGLSFGVVVKNIGPQMTFEGPGLNVAATSPSLDRPEYIYSVEAASFELPSTIEFGLGYRASVGEESALVFGAAFQNNNFSDDAYRGGMEFAFRDFLFVRGGYDYAPPQMDERESIYGPSLGVGLHALVGTTDVWVDYAYRSVKYFNGNHVFSLKVGL